MTKNKKILGHIIALTKNIHLREPADGSGYLNQFRGGDGTTSNPFRVSGLYLNWWFTDRSRKLAEEIVEMAVRFDPDLQYGSRRSLAGTVSDVLKDNALNSDLFEFRKSFAGEVNTLFEARAVANVNEFAECLWDKIYSTLVASISKWLVIFPLVKVKSASVDLGFDGLHLIAPEDKSRWRHLATLYRFHPDWRPDIGGSERANFKNSIKNLPLTWLACEVAAGTDESARELVRRRMRTFISVLFSVLYKSDRAVLNHSSAELHTYSIQFSAHGSATPYTEMMAPIGRIFPPILSEFNLSTDDIDSIKDWYARFHASDETVRQRCTAASQFLNRAIAASDLERFLYFYIALDALFGERHKVEKTISHGLRQIFPADPLWEYRADRLFDLRSMLVHGGCTTIDEWDEIDSYCNHVGSDPERDVANAALTAFYLFPNNPALNAGIPPASSVSPTPAVTRSNWVWPVCLVAFLSGTYLGLKKSPIRGSIRLGHFLRR
jgi:hypothetical protein